MSREQWMIDMSGLPMVPPIHITAACHTNGAELQNAILRGFSEHKDAIWNKDGGEFTFEKTFTFKEHGEFFRGALTMAGLRYTNDFYELLKRYETIKVTIHKYKKIEE